MDKIVLEQKKALLHQGIKVAVIAGILIILFFASFYFGRFDIESRNVPKVMLSQIFPIDKTWPKSYETVVLYIRLPRILAAILIGAALAMAGASYQSVFKNPLVSPDVMGASAGASLGAAIAIFTGLAGIWIQLFAFLLSLGAVALAYGVSKKVKRDPTLALILSGLFISSLANALVSLIKFTADPNDKLPTITYWLMGSLSNITLGDMGLVLIPMVLGAVPLFLLRWRLNVLSMGEDEAKSLGIETKRLRWIVIFCATVLTASAISIGGLIGWVGLIVPHLVRMLVGMNNKVVIPASMLLGGSFLLLVDNIARTMTTVEIPLGVLTAIIGAPFFIILMMQRREA